MSNYNLPSVTCLVTITLPLPVDNDDDQRETIIKRVKTYTNTIALRIEGGRAEEADQLADKYGFRNLGPVIPDGEYYLFENRNERRKSTRKSRNLKSTYISRESNVLWMEKQVAKKRVKRDLRPSSEQPQQRSLSSRPVNNAVIDDTVFHENKRKRTARSTAHHHHQPLFNRPLDDEHAEERERMKQRLLFGPEESALRSRLFHQTISNHRFHQSRPNFSGGVSSGSAHAQLQRLDGAAAGGRRVGSGMALAPLANLDYDEDPDYEGNAMPQPSVSGGRMTLAESGASENSLHWNAILGDGDADGRTYRRRKYGVPNDPYWKDMWYLHRSSELEGEMDHNVREAWDLGFTGRGVVVTILDDGLERTHPDISPNYDAEASYDVNDRDDDPTPRYEYTDENRHGTRCAGEVAAVFNNSLCVVGIAFNARIGGIRMLDGDVTDAVEATSLSHNFQHIDIYSASWGPDDDGRTVDGPATLTRNAFERGIREGRQGRGSIFIWASGNGGKDADSCNCDGYTNSIYTLSISSATERGNIPWYSEACSSTLATAYSSGATGERMIVTTDLHHSCTKSHTGTSASAPLAAGIAALTLESNPDLTWRDLQHIVVRTAKPVNLRAGDWKLNGVRRNVSHSFGYGLLDAGAMVRLAQVWRNVPRQKRCRATYPAPYKTIPRGNRLLLQIYTDGCAGNRETSVKYLEHVQAIVTLNAPKRGDIQIYLSSPKGTRSTLLAKRIRDNSRTGFREWAFMTTHNWGEMAYGTWSLEIDNEGYDDAELLKWDLVMYGTDTLVGAYGAELSVAQRSVGGHYRSENSDDRSAATAVGIHPSIAVLTALLLSMTMVVMRAAMNPMHH